MAVRIKALPMPCCCFSGSTEIGPRPNQCWLPSLMVTGDGDMPDDQSVDLRDQRQGKSPGLTQRTHDELLGVLGMRCVPEGEDRHLLYGLDIGGEFCPDMHGLVGVHEKSGSTMPQMGKEPKKWPMALLRSMSARLGMKKPPKAVPYSGRLQQRIRRPQRQCP